MSHLEAQFTKMGARLKKTVRDRFSSTAPPSFNVRRDEKGEFFEIDVGARFGGRIEVLDVKPDDRHLLVLVRAPDDRGRMEKSKFLCGHDERHWFVAAVPEEASASNVHTAKVALQPPAVREAVTRKKVGGKKALKRKNAAFVRQGEWFFIPAPDINPEPEEIRRNEPLLRAGVSGRGGRGGSKAHYMEFAYRVGGTKVYVRTSTGAMLSESEYARLPESSRAGFRDMVRDAMVYARGKISHPDHAAIQLHGWHRVVMNTENQSKAMQHVVFVD